MVTPIAKRAIVKKRTKKFKRPQSDRILHVPVSSRRLVRGFAQQAPRLCLARDHAWFGKPPFFRGKEETRYSGVESQLNLTGLRYELGRSATVSTHSLLNRSPSSLVSGTGFVEETTVHQTYRD